MATADTSAGDSGPKCARDFVEQRLREADSPMSPAEMATEYGCTNGHLRNLMSDLLDEGVVERVGHGKYVAVSDDDDGSDDEVTVSGVGVSEGNAEAETDASGPEMAAQATPAPTQETRKPVAGPVRSADSDTMGGSPAIIDEDERADVELSEADQDDDGGEALDDDRDDGDGEHVDVDQGGDGGGSRGKVIIAGSVVVVLVVLWLSVQDQPDETPEQADEDETEAAEPDIWGMG